nr:MAG TPA: Radical SAM superfamily [Caudoviricetes sp.]
MFYDCANDTARRHDATNCDKNCRQCALRLHYTKKRVTFHT